MAVAAANDNVSLIVWEVAPGFASDIELIAERMYRGDESTSVLVSIDLSRAASQQVLALTRLLPQAQLSLQGHDDLACEVPALCQRPGERSAHSAIAHGLLPLIAPCAADIVAIASVAGCRRTSVHVLADICGLTVRTLERRLMSEDDHDRHGHGTACAELLLSVAPDSRILPIPVFGRRLETSPAVIEAAVEEAVTRGVRLLNLSLGTTTEESRNALYRSCERARHAGTIIVAASSLDATSYPAAFDNVLSVGIGRFQDLSVFSYRPDERVECLASGRPPTSDETLHRRVMGGGSSFAAPRITGVIARILERWPTADLKEVRARLAEVAYGGSNPPCRPSASE
jgi:hypothetical protein